MAIINLNEKDFEKEVLKSEIPILLYFWAEWCSACKKLSPVVEELAQGFSGKIKVIEVETNKNQKLTEKFEIMSVPMLLIFNHGQKVDQIVGIQPKEIIKQHLDQVL